MSSNLLIFIPDNINIKLRQFSSPARDYKQLIIDHTPSLFSLPESAPGVSASRDHPQIVRYLNIPSRFHLEVLESSHPSLPVDTPTDDTLSYASARYLKLELEPSHPSRASSKGSFKKDLALLGTLRSFIRQILTGIFKRTLVLNGVGYKIELVSHLPPEDRSRSHTSPVRKDNTSADRCGDHLPFLKFIIGYSHPVFFSVPQDIKCVLINSNTLELSSYSLQNLTQFIQKIIQTKPAYKDKYKNKGFELK